MQETLSKPLIKRPWQGTTLILCNIFLSLFSLSSFFVKIQQFSDYNSSSNGYIYIMAWTIIDWYLLIGSFLAFLLSLFSIIGLFRRKKWAIFINIGLIFLSSYPLGTIVLFTPLSDPILSLTFLIFSLYCGFICINHPFFNKS